MILRIGKFVVEFENGYLSVRVADNELFVERSSFFTWKPEVVSEDGTLEVWWFRRHLILD